MISAFKAVSTPRLELQAALIASRFSAYIGDAHGRKLDQTFFWTDSLTVLKWLRSDACSFKAFFSFRVEEIAETTDIKIWRYVPTALDVADYAIRNSQDFTISPRWFTLHIFCFRIQTSPTLPTLNWTISLVTTSGWIMSAL